MSLVQHWAMVGAVCVWIILAIFSLYNGQHDRRCPIWISNLGLMVSLVGLAILIGMWVEAIDSILGQAVNSGRLTVPFP